MLLTLPKKPEILAPAGNFEKLKSALAFGADAVYFAGKNFGMRSAADNFELAEIEEACVYTHSIGKKLYLTTNTVPRSRDIPDLVSYISDILSMKSRPDAYICADIGVASLIMKTIPEADIHISTQANTQNQLTCRMYADMGFSRVILSRELSFEDIRRIKENIPSTLEIECFVHGSMCVSYSGRCLLSNYFTKRDANKGACTQPCRWKYYVTEEKRLTTPLEIVQTEQGSFLFSSRDLCMIEHIDDLVLAGINSFKIEGRMKSSYYAAVVTNAYRIQLDNYYKSPENFAHDNDLKTEVESVSRREYDTGYFYDEPILDAKINTSAEYIREKSYIAMCIGHDESGIPIFEQRNKIARGAPAQILSPGFKGLDVCTDEIYDMDGNMIDATPHPLMKFKMNAGRVVRVGDILRSK